MRYKPISFSRPDEIERYLVDFFPSVEYWEKEMKAES